MDGIEIKKRIVANTKRINILLNKFVLTDEINQLMKENEELRHVCPHEFQNGFCKYCDTPIELSEGHHG